MDPVSGHERHARAALSFLAEPGDEVLGALLRDATAAEVLTAIKAGDDLWPRFALQGGQAGGRRAAERWRARLGELAPPGRIDVWLRSGFRLVCPGDAEWPTQLDDLGDARPTVLWVRGGADVRFSCLRSVSIVGSRAATAYGTHVATDLAADLAGRGWAIISGGAYGIDACAHRGALAVGGCTVAVLASGLSFGYPRGHEALFTDIEASGVLVSECPPDRPPTRPGFLIRNRTIAALSRGTLVVEAARRSGALNTARHAHGLNRLVMAVPGPVTSEQSAGCHDLIRECEASCVTSAADVIELIAMPGEDAVQSPGGSAGGQPSTGRGADGPAADGSVTDGSVADGPAADGPAGHGQAGHGYGVLPGRPAGEPVAVAGGLDPVTASVLGAVARRSGRGPATIATLAGVDLDTALRCIGLLSAAGYIERCDQGWRTRRPHTSR